MANQAYFEGEFYQCVTLTTAAQSPTTTPAKWRRIQIPKQWRRVLAQGTYAELLRIDGQNDKALVERAKFEGQLAELVREEASKEKWRDRPNVETR